MHRTQWAQVTVSKNIMGACGLKSAIQGRGRQSIAVVSFSMLVSPANAKEKVISADREAIVIYDFPFSASLFLDS